MECLRAARRPALGPESVEKALHRHDAIGVEDQNGEQRPLLRAAERERMVPVADLEWPEDPEFHCRLLRR
jgi:hypothetical protein